MIYRYPVDVVLLITFCMLFSLPLSRYGKSVAKRRYLTRTGTVLGTVISYALFLMLSG